MYTDVWGWIWLGCFVCIVVALGLYGMVRTKSEEDFAVARQSYGPVILALCLASTVASGSTYMGIPGLAYSKGFPAIWYPATYPIGVYAGLILSFHLLKKAGDRFRSNSIPEFLGQRYNSDFLRVAFALLSLLLIYYVTAQIVAAATMFQVILGTGYQGGIILTVAVVALYITLGGSHADILTDSFQGLLMIVIAIVIASSFFLGVGFHDSGPGAVNSALVAQDPTLGWDTYFALGDPIFGNIFLVILMVVAHLPFAMTPHVGNKAFALKKPAQLRTFFLLAIPISTILSMPVLGGLHARALLGPDLRPAACIPLLFKDMFPGPVAGFLGIAILAAIMSTADGLFVTLAVVFSNDLYRRTLAPVVHKHKSAQEIDQISLWISRIATLCVSGIAVYLAWDPPEFLAILLWIGMGGIMSGAAGPLLVGSLWKRATRPAAIASFLTGVLLYASFWLVVGWHNPFGAAGVCVLIGSVVMVVVSLATKPMPPDYLDRVFQK